MGIKAMKLILLSTLVALGVAAGAAFVLDTRFQESTEQRFTTAGVRLDPQI